MLRPTPQQIKKYRLQFENSLNSMGGERVLRDVFTSKPNNKSYGDILQKVVLVNAITNTRIWKPYQLAEHIQKLNLDKLISEENLGVVEKIRRCKFGKKKRDVYSFATKYCSYHKPKIYPIFDQYISHTLVAYYKRDHFFDERVTKKRMRDDYEFFVKVIRSFQSHYGLQKCNIRSIDHFLWACGKRLLKK